MIVMCVDPFEYENPDFQFGLTYQCNWNTYIMVEKGQFHQSLPFVLDGHGYHPYSIYVCMEIKVLLHVYSRLPISQTNLLCTNAQSCHVAP